MIECTLFIIPAHIAAGCTAKGVLRGKRIWMSNSPGIRVANHGHNLWMRQCGTRTGNGPKYITLNIKPPSSLHDTLYVRGKHLPRLRDQGLPAILFLLGQGRHDLQDVCDHCRGLRGRLLG